MTACAACGHDAAAIVASSWSFFVELDSKSMNARVVNAGASRWAYAAERDRWSLRIRAVFSQVPVATGFRRVTMTRCYAGRQQPRDYDNLVGGTKPILDALVRWGLLVDDSAKFAQVTYKQERATPTGVRFLLEELAA